MGRSLAVAQATRTCPQCKTRCALRATTCPACSAPLPTQIVVESLLGKDPVASNGSNGNGNGSNGNGNGNGRPRGPEIEYDDIEAPRGHVVRSKRVSAILSGELQTEPPM